MFAEDKTVFMQTRDFAEVCIYDGGTEVNGNFNESYTDALGMSGTFPMLECNGDDIPQSGVGKTVVIRGLTYRIRERMKVDDGAFVHLKLERQ